MEFVLIEDDDDDALRLMKFLRQHFNNPIRRISDGNSAAEFLLYDCDSVPKLIFLDVILPYIDGIELYNLIRLEPEKRNLKIIFLITSEKEKDYLEALGVKPDAFIKKPTSCEIPSRM